MYEKIAWNNFCKTGNIESFMEYRKLINLNSNDEILDEIENVENIGDILSGFNKSQRDSNKGDCL